VTIHPTIRGCAIALLGIVGVASFVVARYEAQIAELAARLTGAQVEALGPNWTAVRTARDVAAAVPGLVDEIAGARKAGTKPAAGIRVTSGETAFNLPDWSPCDRSAAPLPGIAG
jgi:hypothetical protein